MLRGCGELRAVRRRVFPASLLVNHRLGIISATLALSVTVAFAAVQCDPRQAIETANAELGAAFGRGDARAVAAMYTEGGQLYS
jgi:hypothetical protein